MEDYQIKVWDTFNPQPLGCFKADKSGNVLMDDFVCLDTETSHNHADDKHRLLCWIYQWALTYQGQVVMGRKPSEMMQCLQQIKDVNRLGVDGKQYRRIAIYVHNLSYDYAYISNWVRQSFDDDGKSFMIATASHQVLSWDYSGLWFKCSAKLCGKSLDKWSKDLNTKHQKQVDTVDYDLIRYQDTKLTDIDDKYMAYDVIVQDECIRKQMQIYGDTLKTIPLTVTGYVRRECKRYFNADKSYRTWFRKTALDYNTYTMCRQEYAGGLTHGNRFLVEETISVGDTLESGIKVESIKHRDFASHYPSQIIYYADYPISKFDLFFDFRQNSEMSLSSLKKLASKKCVLVDIAIKNMVIKKGITLPYAQYSKFSDRCKKGTHFIEDNGRILKMDGETIVTLNDIDLDIIDRQYTFDYAVLTVYTATRGKCPKYIRDTVMEYYHQKTEYKNICKSLLKQGYDEASDEYIEANQRLMIAKGMLNGIYGMCSTDINRTEWEESMIDGRWHPQRKTGYKDVSTVLKEYYNKYTSFTAYQIGTYITALARRELIYFADQVIGFDRFLYADTDSIFYASDDETEARIEAVNQGFRDVCDKEGYYIEQDGKRVYYNQFELEDENITSFRFLHSKCYAYITDDTDLHCTIAGVSKFGKDAQGNRITRNEELGSIDNLASHKTFNICGGKTKIYTDLIPPTIASIDGHQVEISSGVVLKQATKTLKCEEERNEMWFDWRVDDIYEEE